VTFVGQSLMQAVGLPTITEGQEGTLQSTRSVGAERHNTRADPADRENGHEPWGRREHVTVGTHKRDLA
jgi:hypothetical protein